MTVPAASGMFARLPEVLLTDGGDAGLASSTSSVATKSPNSSR
ncbi:hypothetical protein [Saccharomonospora marina]|nr:hypothetical protein [Saccharomonospora marina]